jgi:drug/metabolite transporter (DMT)-like permease
MGWVTAHAVAVFSALLSAFWAAAGIVVRQRATQGVPGDEAMSAAMATTLVRQPLWWAGTFAAIAGYVFQAVALAHGSLLLVQPLLVSSLLFALPLSAALCHQRISRVQWGWAMLLTAALAVFLLVDQPHEGHNRPPIPAWTLALAITVPSVIACVIAAHRAAGRTRAMLLGVAVAVLLGMIAVVTKVCTHRYSIGGWHALMTVPAPYVLVALAVTVTVVQNSAFHAGALQASVPIMLVGEPIVAVVLGVVVLGEHLAIGGVAVPALLIAVLAMVAATIALGRSQAIDNVDVGSEQPLSPAARDEAMLAAVGGSAGRPGGREHLG